MFRSSEERPTLIIRIILARPVSRLVCSVHALCLLMEDFSPVLPCHGQIYSDRQACRDPGFLAWR